MTVYTFDERIVSDLHKEVYGCRPRDGFYAQWKDADQDGKQKIWDDLCDAHEVAIETARAEEIRAIEEFEARVDGLVALGAGNRLTAIRWIVDGLELTQHDCWYGTNYICHLLGLPYRLGGLFTEALEDITKTLEVVE